MAAGFISLINRTSLYYGLIVGISLFFLIFYLTISGQSGSSKEFSDLNIDLLDHWNRNAAYDSVLYYLQPKYDRWRKEEPIKIAESFKYFYNAHKSRDTPALTDSLDLFEQLIREQNGEVEALNFLYMYRAYHMLESGQWEEAKSMAEAIAARKSLAQSYPRLYSDANSLAAFIVSQFGETDKALKLNQTADSTLIATFGEDYFGRIVTLNNFSIIYEMIGHHKGGLEAAIQTIDIVEKYYAPAHENHLKALNTLALKYNTLGKSEEAIKLYEKVIQLNKESGRDVNLFDAYLNISATYTGKWDYITALKYLELAQANLVNSGISHPFYQLEIYLRHASLATDEGDMDKAAKYVDLMKDWIRQKFEPTDYRLRNAYALFHVYHRELGEHDPAMLNLEKYIAIQEMYVGRSSLEWAHSLGWKGELYRKMNLPDSAYLYNMHSMELYKDLVGETHHYYIEVKVEQIKTLIGWERYREAQELINDILWIGREGKDKSRLPSYEDIHKHIHLRSVLELKIKLLELITEEANQELLLEKAVLYEYLNNEFNRLQISLGSFSSQDFILKDSERVFKQAVANCYDLYENTRDDTWIERAFLYAERTRALKIQEIMRSRLAMIQGGIPPEVQQREIELLLYRKNLEEQLISLTDTDSPEYVNLSSTLAETNLAYNDFVRKLEKEYPRYFDLKYNVDLADFKQVRSGLLNRSRSLAQYTILDNSVYIIVVNRNTSQLVKIDLPENFEDMVKDYHSFLRYRAFDPDHAGGAELYELLFAPVAASVGESNELIIVPDGWMYYLNPESFPLPDEPGKYVLHRYNVVFNYSPTVALQNAEYSGRQRTKVEWVGFVPGFQAKEDQSGEVRFISQPWAANLADSISTLYQSLLFKGDRANKNTFEFEAGQGAILHIGTHAVANDRDPLQSYLVLSSDDGNYELLKAGEIFNKQMKSMCTVLTACETALGSIKSGEGMVSLARAFAYAGCPNLVVTLWSVDDQQTAGIMKQFYKKVAGGKSLHESLYESKLAYLDQAKGELRHPFYWAGITYFGTDATLRSGWWDRMGLLSVILAGILLFSAVVLYVKKRKNSRS